MNALNQQLLLSELCAALEDADGSDKVRCIIVTGSEKAFAAGADIKEMSEMTFVEVYAGSILFEHFANGRIAAIRKPIIAAVSAAMLWAAGANWR